MNEFEKNIVSLNKTYNLYPATINYMTIYLKTKYVSLEHKYGDDEEIKAIAAYWNAIATPNGDRNAELEAAINYVMR